jgi:hypothetical protein
MAEKQTAMKRHPLTLVLITVSPKPFLFLRLVGNLSGAWNLRDREQHVLLFLQTQRSERAKQTILEYSFQMLGHDLILLTSSRKRLLTV